LIQYLAEDVLKQWGCYQRSISIPSLGYPSVTSCFRAIKATSPDYSDLPEDMLAEWGQDDYPPELMEAVEVWICELGYDKTRVVQLYYVRCLSYRNIARTFKKQNGARICKNTANNWVREAGDRIQVRLGQGSQERVAGGR